jgi:hypothetical protein
MVRIVAGSAGGSRREVGGLIAAEPAGDRFAAGRVGFLAQVFAERAGATAP